MRSYKYGTSSQIRATSNDSTTVLKGFPVLVPPSGLPNKFNFQGSKEEDFGPGTEDEEVGWRMFPIHNSVWSLVDFFLCISTELLLNRLLGFVGLGLSEDHHDDCVFLRRGSQVL